METKIGVSLAMPTDMRLWYERQEPTGLPKYLAYSSHVGKCVAALTQSAIPKDEDLKESEALRLDQAALEDIDTEKVKITSIRHFASQGWPTLEMELTPDIGSTITLGGAAFDIKPGFGAVWFRITRTKTAYYMVQVWGQFTKEDREKMLASCQVPKDAGVGPNAKWGPEPKMQKLADDLVEVWAPIEFKEDKADVAMIKGPDSKSYLAEFGCERFAIGVTMLPPGAVDQLDDSLMEQIIQGVSSEAPASGYKVVFGPPKIYRSNQLDFHYATGHTEGGDVRVDVTVTDNRIFIFTTSVPRGMLESDEIKRYIASYSIH